MAEIVRSPAKLRFLRHLREENLTLTEITGRTGLSTATVHYHMTQLAALRIIEVGRDGARKPYALTALGRSLLADNPRG